MKRKVVLEKTITINLSNPNNTTIACVGCDGQDLYKGLCAFMAHIKTKLVNPDKLEEMLETALNDVAEMEKM